MTDPQTPNNAEENEATSTEGVAADHTSSEAPASTNEQEGANADPPKPQPTTAVRAGKKSDKKDKKKDGLWHGTFKPILEVVVVVFLFRALIIDWNDVPSGSMLPTIQIGDRIAVNRLAYGLNLPIPFLRHDKQGKGFLDLPFTDKRMPFPLPGQIIRWNDPDRGDIVIVWSPQEDHNLGTRLVKRIVAIPGDTVKVANGELYINGIKGEYEPIESSFMQTADQGRTREIQRYTESFPELDFEHVMQMPIQFPPGKAYDQVVNDLAQDAYKLTSIMPGLSVEAAQQAATKRAYEKINQIGAPQNLHDSPERTLEEGEYMCMGDNRQFSNDCRIFGPVSRKQIVGRAFGIAFSFKNGKMTQPNFGRFFNGLE